MQNQRKATVLALIAVALWSTVATAFEPSLRHLDPLLAWATLFSNTGAGRLDRHAAAASWTVVVLQAITEASYFALRTQSLYLLPGAVCSCRKEI